jgi:hypothetical protein
VEDTYDSPDGYPDQSWGLPLTESEAADLNARSKLQNSLGEAVAFARETGKFGGLTSTS